MNRQVPVGHRYFIQPAPFRLKVTEQDETVTAPDGQTFPVRTVTVTLPFYTTFAVTPHKLREKPKTLAMAPPEELHQVLSTATFATASQAVTKFFHLVYGMRNPDKANKARYGLKIRATMPDPETGEEREYVALGFFPRPLTWADLSLSVPTPHYHG